MDKKLPSTGANSAPEIGAYSGKSSRIFGPRRLSHIVETQRNFLTDFSGHQSKHFGTLLRHWSAIVGSDLAHIAIPMALKFDAQSPASTSKVGHRKSEPSRRVATLSLRVPQSHALEIHYRQSRILQIIQDVFGYPLVSKIKIVQGQALPSSAQPYTRSLPNDADKDLGQAEAARLPQGELRDAVSRLAACVHMRQRKLGKEDVDAF